MPKVETFDRKQVLQNATEVFHKKGYNGTSMQDLVDATNLNRSSIYNSFGSKLSMFMEVLSYYQSSGKAEMGKELAHSHNALDTMKLIFEMYLNDILDDKDRKGCLIVNCKSEMANQEPLIKSFMEQNQEQSIAMLEDVVHNGQMEKIFNEDQTANQYALYLYSSIQGLRMTGILNNNEEELRNLINTVLKVLY
ncbi:TetR/AcrR family transcriptional regulator [Aquimarina sp. MMG016]|uniref:TetR/AcrR family transcriptional regulator n=1 Tax=Aquimarina sp. MMG016 TaxID=2822690 RepID=UPI001B3A5FD7|nr:TetR/AcrR family transcriptional regulator [Aquimarina sp. MMG016]MBQ4819503.1 TetR/AcrR family transcriptional regulator [Aquimarina sp. MMG016]